MYQDYKDLLCAFHAHGVKYLIVGAYAVRLPRERAAVSQGSRAPVLVVSDKRIV